MRPVPLGFDLVAPANMSRASLWLEGISGVALSDEHEFPAS